MIDRSTPRNHDELDVRQFRFRASDVHNRDMLEYQSEKAHLAGALDLAAQFAIAAAIYGLTAIHNENG